MPMTPQQILAELPAPIQVVVFGEEVPKMDGAAGRRVSAAWRRAGVELEECARRLRAEAAALPGAVSDDLGNRIVECARPLCAAAEDFSKFCRSLAQHTARSTADSDKQVYVMYAFGAMTVYQILIAGGWHPIRALQILSNARTKHLANFRAFVTGRIGAGAAARAERTGLLASQIGGFAVLAGAVDAGVQAGQMLEVLDGPRDAVDWGAAGTAAAMGGSSALGGLLGAHAVQTALPRTLPLLMGNAVVATTSGVSGVIGGALAAAAITGRFELSTSALVSSVALGLAGAHLHSRAQSEVSSLVLGTAGDQKVGSSADLLDLPESSRRVGETASAVAAKPAEAEILRPVTDARTETTFNGDARPSAREGTGQSVEPPANGGSDAVLYQRINELREQEFAETRAAGGEINRIATGPPEGSVPTEAGGRTDSFAKFVVADSEPLGRDQAEWHRLVTERDQARAALADLLGITPQEVRWWGHSPLEQALISIDTWLGQLGEQGWARMEPSVREGVLSDLGRRVVDDARASVAEGSESAAVRQWLERMGLTQPVVASDGPRWSAIRAVAAAEGMPTVARLVDGLERYSTADSRLAAADGRAGDGTWDPGHPRYGGFEPAGHEMVSSRSRIVVGGTDRVGATTDPVAGGEGTVADPLRDGPAVSRTADIPLPAEQDATTLDPIRQFGAVVTADVVSRVRASDFKVLELESARAGSALARWLALSDSEFFRMNPSRLREAVELQVGRAERMPDWAERARPDAGGLIGDLVRRGMAADAESGRMPISDDVSPARAIPDDLQRRLREWAGTEATIVQRWTDVQALRDRLLDNPGLMLRLSSNSGAAVPADAVTGPVPKFVAERSPLGGLPGDDAGRDDSGGTDTYPRSSAPGYVDERVTRTVTGVRELPDMESAESQWTSGGGALSPMAAARRAESDWTPRNPTPTMSPESGSSAEPGTVPPSGPATSTPDDVPANDGTSPYSVPNTGRLMSLTGRAVEGNSSEPWTVLSVSAEVAHGSDQGIVVARIPMTCFVVAAEAAAAGPGERPRFDIPSNRRLSIDLAGVDARDAARWAGANWHAGGFADVSAIIEHVRRNGGTVLGAVEFGQVGAHAFTVKLEDGVVVVVEQTAEVDGRGDAVVETQTVRGDAAVELWADRLMEIAGADASFHGLVFKADGTPETPLPPDQEPTGNPGREFSIHRLGARIPDHEPPSPSSAASSPASGGELDERRARLTDLLAKPTPLSFEEARTAIDDALIVHPKQVAECMDRMVGYQREYVKLVFLERLDKQVVAARLSKTPRDVYRSIGYPAVRRLVALIARALEPQPGEPEGVSVEQRSARLAELLAQPMPLGHEQARVLIEDALILHEDEVAKCIARMSGLQREYVRLSFLEHLGDEAVAARLGRTPREVYRLGEFPGVRRLATLVARELAMPSGGPGGSPADWRAARLADLLAKPRPLSFEEARTVVEDASIVHPEGVADCVAKLPDLQRRSVELRFRKGIHRADVAEQLGTTPRAVAQAERWGLKTLVDLISEMLGIGEVLSVEQRSVRLAEMLAQPAPLPLEQARTVVADALIVHSDVVARCIAQLTPVQREYVELSFVEGLDKLAVAERLGKTPREVYRSIEHRGVRRLAESIAGALGARDVVPVCHARGRCAVLVTELHRLGTGKWSLVVPTDIGAAGMSAGRFKATLGGRPQRFSVDPERPHRWVEGALLELLEGLDPAERSGVSVVVIDSAKTADEYGVNGHAYRLEFRCDRWGAKGRIWLQDPGRQRFGVWEDAAGSSQLAGIWAMAFDRLGNPLVLPGAGLDEDLPDGLRVGESDVRPG
ncbi:hypothetical protein [Nocardia wallacei]|uniref:Uncharacterized protein n=1 Tax=Nocardia wallacei TaxID=480035 RepID=A0A7G1KV47_9NOCA|nr:hypothetical protein [Nocardia wallacei]BCK59110.1 hypothetical protein NWFMUON74_68820 [Nocardia wallacei]